MRPAEPRWQRVSLFLRLAEKCRYKGFYVSSSISKAAQEVGGTNKRLNDWCLVRLIGANILSKVRQEVGLHFSYVRMA